MADFQVRIDSGNNFTVSQEKTVVAEFLSDLGDVSVPNLPSKDKFVLVYNATIQKYELVSADQVLQTAVEDVNLPQEFVDQLDVDLDNKIDVDAGSF
jgi:hypothetical protein